MDEEARLLADFTRGSNREESLHAYIAWLESQGDIRADYLKVELELLALPESDKRYRPCKAELRELRRQVDPNWRLLVTQAIVNNCGAIDAPEGMFEFQCPLQWTSLQPTDDATVRYCDTCRQHVHLCDTLQEAERLADRGACIAIDLAAKPERKMPPKRDDDAFESKRKRRVMGRFLATKLNQDRLKVYPSQRLRAPRRKRADG